MEISLELREKLDDLIEKENIKELQKATEEVSNRYRDIDRDNTNLITNSKDAIAYSLYRMPATYCAVYTAMKHIMELTNIEAKTMLDVGAGTGAATWAINELMKLQGTECIEKEIEMSNIGKKLLNDKNNRVVWKQKDAVLDNIEEKADIVVCAYMLNEINHEEQIIVLEKLWKATNNLLLIVDIGTRNGHEEILKIREWLIENNGHIIAPCTHEKKCMLDKDDWCHCTCRVPRTKMHKYLKGGTVPYEDEKFSYIAVAKTMSPKAQNRVLRHPKIEKGNITLKICNQENIQEMRVTKANKDLYKKAKKVECGDQL